MFIGAGPASLVKEEDVAARVLVLAPARRQRRRQRLRSYESVSPVCGLTLLPLYAAVSYCCTRPYATTVCGLTLRLYAALHNCSMRL